MDEKLLSQIRSTDHFRSAEIVRESIDQEELSVEVAISSDTPIERMGWFESWFEILDHKSKSIRHDRLKRGLPILVDHDRTSQIGVMESYKIADGRIRGVVRFSKNNPRAVQEFNDVADGIRQDLSVGYGIHEMVLERESKDGPSTYRVTDWEPREASFVAIPADTSVGVGRSDDPAGVPEEATHSGGASEGVVPMGNEDNTATEVRSESTTPTPEPKVDVSAVREEARKEELDRVSTILSIASRHGMEELGQRYIEELKPVDAFREAVLEGLGNKPAETAEIGLSPAETRRYSFMRAINAMASGNWKDAEFEREVSIATAERMKKDPQGVFVPMDILTRDLTVGIDADGGYLKGTDHLAGSFIDALRNKTVVVQAGANILDGLVGDIAIPKLSAGATTYWVAESGAITESTQTFASVTMAPKTLGAMVDISRKLRLQSAPSVDMLIQDDLATVVAIEVDRAALHGSGASNQPTGVAATSGIGSVAGGTNGLAPAWSHIVQLEREVSVDNADVGALSYITNPKVRSTLKTVFTNATYGDIPIYAMDKTINGYPSYITNQVASNLTKGTSSGVCSAIFFGNWNDLLIGQWGALDINVDTSTGSSSGTVRVVALLDVDIAVRHAESFAAMLDALTA